MLVVVERERGLRLSAGYSSKQLLKEIAISNVQGFKLDSWTCRTVFANSCFELFYAPRSSQKHPGAPRKLPGLRKHVFRAVLSSKQLPEAPRSYQEAKQPDRFQQTWSTGPQRNCPKGVMNVKVLIQNQRFRLLSWNGFQGKPGCMNTKF